MKFKQFLKEDGVVFNSDVHTEIHNLGNSYFIGAKANKLKSPYTPGAPLEIGGIYITKEIKSDGKIEGAQIPPWEKVPEDVMKTNPDYYLYNFNTEKFKNMGIGSKILNTIFNKFKGNIILNTSKKNENARKLYSKFGFRVVGNKDEYDRIWMVKVN